MPKQSNSPEPQDVSEVVEHLFRHESGKMVAILTRIFGIEHLNLAEDVVQEALARALQTWPFYGVPQNPSAWIMRASRNLALDVVRRQKVFRDKEAQIIHLMDRENPPPDSPEIHRTGNCRRPAADDVCMLPSADSRRKRRWRWP